MEKFFCALLHTVRLTPSLPLCLCPHLLPPQPFFIASPHWCPTRPTRPTRRSTNLPMCEKEPRQTDEIIMYLEILGLIILRCPKTTKSDDYRLKITFPSFSNRMFSACRRRIHGRMLYDCVAYMRFDRPLNPLRHLRVGGIGIRAEKYITLLPPPPPPPSKFLLLKLRRKAEKGRESGARAGDICIAAIHPYITHTSP